MSKQLPRTLLDDLDPKDWLLEQGYAGAGDEDAKTAAVNFRWASKNERLASELREAANSPYAHLWPTKSDMFRHICIIGLVALAKGYTATKGSGMALEGQIRRAARAAFLQSEREAREAAVGACVDSVYGDIQAGDYVSAGRHLDLFMEEIHAMTDDWLRESWGKALTNHPVYKSAISPDAKLRTESNMLDSFEQVYQ